MMPVDPPVPPYLPVGGSEGDQPRDRVRGVPRGPLPTPVAEANWPRIGPIDAEAARPNLTAPDHATGGYVSRADLTEVHAVYPAPPPAVAPSTGTSEDVDRDEWCICSTEFRALAGEAHTRICSQQWADLVRLLAAREAAARAIAEDIAYQHAATIDGEYGCCHDEDALRAGGRVPEFDGDEFEPIPDDCPGKQTLDRHLDRIAASGGAR